MSRGEENADSEFASVDGTGGLGMFGQFFGDSFGELGTNMPEKRVPPGKEQAHEAVADENETT